MHSIRYSRIRMLTFLISLTVCCADGAHETADTPVVESLYNNHDIRVGAELTDLYFPLLKGKRIGLVVNQTSLIGSKHLADSLLSSGFDVRTIFAPEHGFRGTADAGATIRDGVDTITGLPVVSLYGSHKKPTDEQLAGIDLLIFDIQDVGARFYTYISTLHYVMEAAAENGREVMVLDRPNPNGHYVAGPVLDTMFRSFVGMHPVPVVHGMTVGEYARMINGEGWLKNGRQCTLRVIPCEGYDHKKFYRLPVAPSPNLPNMRAVYLYPALCLFEGTDVSVGRGTSKQFQVLGAPDLRSNDSMIYEFTPEPMPGAASPKHNGKTCRGWDLSTMDEQMARDTMLAPAIYMQVYRAYSGTHPFFTSFFDKLAGGSVLRSAIEAGAPSDLLSDVYDSGVDAYKVMRRKYLLYEDFE